MKKEEMARVARKAAEELRHHYTSGLDVPAESKTTKELDVMAAALEAELDEPEPLAEGWAMPEHNYYVGPHTQGCDWKPKYERQIRIYLDRAPKGSKRVIVMEAGDE